jgi:opacity protein-like surface antigen
MGIAGDFVANVTSSRVERDQVGTFAGRENRVIPREIELSFFGQVDPYARATVILEAAEEFEDGERALEFGLAEAYLELTSLPFGLGAKGGRERLRFGLLNEYHLHDRPQTDSPAVLTRFFGEEGLTEDGLEVSWVAPLPVYLQAIVGAFNGDNEEAFGYGSLRDPLLSARLRTFFELGVAGAVQLGASGLYGRTTDGARASYLGVDAKYKYTPAGWAHALLTVGGEVLFAHRKVSVGGEEGGEVVAPLGRRLRQEPGEATFEERDAYGYYVWLDVQPWKQWLVGLRYDWTELPDGPGREWAIEPYLAWMPSEFLRFRLGYKYTDRQDFGAGPSTLSELFLQATFILGAHPAHPF